MPRDYKHVSPRRAPAKKTSSPFVWAAVAFLLGLFVMGLFWLKMQPPSNAPEWVGAEPERKPREVAKPVGPPKKIQPEKPETRFTFFKDLSQRKWWYLMKSLSYVDRAIPMQPRVSWCRSPH